MKIYNKLVRDKIPAIIEASGKKCNCHVLTDEEYWQALETKLDEEVKEFHEDKSIEELADVLEVVQALCEAKGENVDTLFETAKKKAEERGKFRDKICLDSVE